MVSRLPPMDGLIFDLDGTLVDTLADIATAINLTRRDYRLDSLPPEAITCHVGDGTAHLVRVTVPVGEGEFEQAHDRYLAHYDTHLFDETRPYEGVEEVLAHYASRPLGIVTNKPIGQTERIVQGLGWGKRFRVVLGGDSLARRKPDPLPIRTFLDRCGLAAERVVMIGDGTADIRAGRAAGVFTVAVTHGVGTRDALAAENPHFLIREMGELPALVP